MDTIKIALLGFGTVGQGTYELLKENKEIIEKRIGLQLDVTKILHRRPEEYESYSFMPETSMTVDIEEIVNDPEIHIVVELMGGEDFAYDCIVKALRRGKHVVTANKDLIAAKGPQLLALAEEHQADLRFEAAVLGAIPVIRSFYESLGSNKVTEILGIMNGTTNFILSKMTAEGKEYGEALAEAQALGFAEADPSSDVEGYDAARKLAILASIAFNRRIFFDDVTVEGISTIAKADIEYAEEFDYAIKLLAVAKDTKQGIFLNVYPTFLPKSHPLAAVRGAYNAVYVKGNGIGDAMFYGKGAGGKETGSSVLADIMEIANNFRTQANGRITQFYFSQKEIFSSGKMCAPYYIRMEVDNATGVLAKISGKLADHHISVYSIIQRIEQDDTAVLVIVTNKCPHAHMMNCIDSFNSLKCVKKVYSVIRVTEEVDYE